MRDKDFDRRPYRDPKRAAGRLLTQGVMLHAVLGRMVKIRVHGRRNVDGLKGAFIAVANHSSHLDAPLVIDSLPQRLSRYLAPGAAADYFFTSKIKTVLTRAFMNTYPIERRGVRTRKGLTGQLLTDGVPLLVFPEGTRSRTGAMGPFTPGVAALCISREVPCLPMALVGAFAAWPYGQNHPPRGRPEVHVVIGHPLRSEPGEIAKQFNERIRRTVQRLHDSTARAYGMPTLDDYARAVALRQTSVPRPGSSRSLPTADPGGDTASKE